MMERRRFVVIGAGMAGLSTAYRLRSFGAEVLVVERDRVGAADASSAGESRMYREMYSDPYLARMSRVANQRWAALEAEHGAELRSQHGLLFYGEDFDEETLEGSIPGARRVMDAEGIPYESLDRDQIAERFPLKPRPGDVGLFEPTAGAVLADRVLALWSQEIREAGVEVAEGESVHGIDLDGSGPARVRTTRRTVEADQVVLCVGPWTNELLAPLGLELALEVWGIYWAHYEIDPAIAPRMPQWFLFRREDPTRRDGGLYYGFPVLGEARAAGRAVIKVGIDWAPEELRAHRLADLPRQVPEHLVSLVDQTLAEQVAGIGPRLGGQLSPYTMTSDLHFVLDRLHPRLSLFTGGSGQAFKFAPLLGELLAQVAQDRGPSFDIGPLRAHRPAVGRRRAA